MWEYDRRVVLYPDRANNVRTVTSTVVICVFALCFSSPVRISRRALSTALYGREPYSMHQWLVDRWFAREPRTQSALPWKIHNITEHDWMYIFSAKGNSGRTMPSWGLSGVTDQSQFLWKKKSHQLWQHMKPHQCKTISIGFAQCGFITWFWTLVISIHISLSEMFFIY